MSSPILHMMKSGRVLLGDGAMGTELQQHGLPAGSCPELLNLDRPETVRAVHRNYVAAGSDLIETNSFGANRIRMAMHGLEGRVVEVCRRAAELARQECPAERFVAGSVGPIGDLLEPFGTRTLEEAYEVFGESASALAEGGVDLILIETMMAIEEAEVALRASKERTGLPVFVTMTFERGASGLRTSWGVDVPTAARRLEEAGADAIGANCGRGVGEMIDIIGAMRPLTTLPIIAQANAGLPEWVGGVSVYRETPEAIRPDIERLLGQGIALLGGCCGTGPDHIRMMRSAIDAQYHGA
jgi:5-methyltetrahydrofolate--homocysteine methyltransferase